MQEREGLSGSSQQNFACVTLDDVIWVIPVND
jgi:hypothetical protein